MANHYATALNATPSYGERFGKKLLTLTLIAIPLGFLLACMIAYVMPRKYESRAVVQVNPSHRLAMTPSGDLLQSQMTPQFFATQFEVIRSQATLAMVAEKLNLAKLWNTSVEDAIVKLTSIVDVQNIRGTDLIAINVMHTGPEDARDIAREVYEAFKARRLQGDKEMANKYLGELEKALQNQSDMVEKKTQELARKKPTPPPVQHPAVTNQEVREQLKKNLDQLTQAKNEDERILLAGTMLVGENPVKAIYQEYLKAGDELDGLRQKQASEIDPAVAAKEKSIQTLSAKMQTTLADYMKELQTVLARAEEMDVIELEYPIQKKEWEFYKAELQKEQQKLDEMKQLLITAQINAKQPQNICELHEEPVIAKVPSSPRVNRMLLLGGVGLPFAVLLLGLPLTVFIHLVSRR
jgi:capsular polysaccharide biosynthesis protein